MSLYIHTMSGFQSLVQNITVLAAIKEKASKEKTTIVERPSIREASIQLGVSAPSWRAQQTVAL